MCITCSGIGHGRLGGCGERPAQCVICAGAHKSENYKCGITGCATKRRKICIHVVLKHVAPHSWRFIIHGYLPHPWISTLVRRCVSPVSSQTDPPIGKKSMDEAIDPSIAPPRSELPAQLHEDKNRAPPAQ